MFARNRDSLALDAVFSGGDPISPIAPNYEFDKLHEHSNNCELINCILHSARYREMGTLQALSSLKGIELCMQVLDWIRFINVDSANEFEIHAQKFEQEWWTFSLKSLLRKSFDESENEVESVRVAYSACKYL